MITKSDFILLIERHQKQQKRLDKLVGCGFDLWGSPVVEYGWLMFDQCLSLSFVEEGLDWINWWLFERDNEWCSEIGKAFDENNNEIPTETIDDLWNIVEKYRI